MVIYGVDFTSSPSARKPITCAVASLDEVDLRVAQVVKLLSFHGFEDFLQSPGPWRTGFDFPFGQPRKLLENLGVNANWAESVAWLTSQTRADFEKLLAAYRGSRSKGDKHHFRRTDLLAGSCSPMMLYRVPVAKMFFEGAPRLLRSGASVLPGFPREDSRVAVEAYPKLVAARYTGARYKAESDGRQTKGMRKGREQILAGLGRHAPRDYGLNVMVADDVREAAIVDATGDVLDSVLCAVQAAWSALQLTPPNGIPADCDRCEGWIVDPYLVVLNS